ncbi:acyltransferase [Sulfobacillus sp. hq2]|uniref:acyltransferase n=1 Tax=Sulfobacillus sp. hq2 TaxID=2039167 RepID=UPI000CD2E896|nr:acyltransferase [Sulfobacillus sp. hq2]MCY0908615.1 acyltransferase [Sulfobacillus thermotolerans]POB10300.1 UDP-3-O-(3-hydroxymyristoyl)glucosamine N-acyltransferase [Sulfobacillus sp. hq2]
MTNHQQGLHCVIEEGARIGQNVTLGHHVIVHKDVVIGDNVVIGDGAILGKAPARSKTSNLHTGNLEPLIIGEGTVIGAQAILYRGAKLGRDCFIADQAVIRERCILGAYVVVGQRSTVENDCTIGDYTKLQTAVYLTAHTTVEDHVFIAPMVTTTNDPYVARTEARHDAILGPTIHRAARIGGGAVILPGIHVGQEALIAAGAVVTRDVAAYRLVMGVPARVVRQVPEEQWIFWPDGSHKETLVPPGRAKDEAGGKA